MSHASAKPRFVILLAALALGVPACSSPAPEAGGASPVTSGGSETPAAPPDVQVEAWTQTCTSPVETLGDIQDAARFMVLLAPARMAQTFDEMQGATVFVPTNAALDALPPEIERDPAALRNFLAGHFTMGTLSTELLREAGAVELLDQARTSLPVGTARGATQVGPAHIIRPDLRCSGVTVHMVDAILPVGAFDPNASANPFQVNLWRLPAE